MQMDAPGPPPMGPPGAAPLPPPMAPLPDDGMQGVNRASMAPSMGQYSVGPGTQQPVHGWQRFIEPGMAILSGFTSFIGMVAEIVVVAQGIQAYLMKDQVNKASDTKTKTKTVSPDNDLLGRRALVAYLVKRQNKPDKQPADAIVQYYVPNTDIPTRAGAVGFNAVSHILVAVIFAALLWVQWSLYRRQPPSFLGDFRRTASYIAAVQCFIAFDLLGRNISPLAQAGAYLLFIFSLVNIGYSMHKTLNTPPAQPYRDSMYDPEMQPPPMQEDLLPPEDGLADALNEKVPEDQEERLADPAAAKRPGRRRSRTVSTVVSSSVASAYSNATGGPDDVDSYYLRSPTLRGGAPRPPARVAFADSARQQQHSTPMAASSPVTLYGPLEQQRRAEQVRRSRRLSLTAPAIGEIPPYQQEGTGFYQRSLDPMATAIPEEEDEETAAVALQNDRVSRDGFAHRAQEWRKLQRMI